MDYKSKLKGHSLLKWKYLNVSNENFNLSKSAIAVLYDGLQRWLCATQASPDCRQCPCLNKESL